MSLDQLSTLETTVLTFGITTILLLGTTFYYIKQRKNNDNDNSGVVEDESVKELDRSVSLCVLLVLFYFAYALPISELIPTTHNILYSHTSLHRRNIQEDT